MIRYVVKDSYGNVYHTSFSKKEATRYASRYELSCFEQDDPVIVHLHVEEETLDE